MFAIAVHSNVAPRPGAPVRFLYARPGRNARRARTARHPTFGVARVKGARVCDVENNLPLVAVSVGARRARRGSSRGGSGGGGGRGGALLASGDRSLVPHIVRELDEHALADGGTAKVQHSSSE